MSTQKKGNNVSDNSKSGHLLQPVSIDDRYHVGGRKRLSDAVQDFQMTLQHAIRIDLVDSLKQRAVTDSLGIMPPLNLHEMFDYLCDTDTEFFNWMFPYCAVKLSKNTLPHTFAFLVQNFRRELMELDGVTPSPSNTSDYAE